VAGDVRDRLVREVLAHRETNPPDVHAEFPRMSKRKEPYQTRMRTLGKQMYSLSGDMHHDVIGEAFTEHRPVADGDLREDFLDQLFVGGCAHDRLLGGDTRRSICRGRRAAKRWLVMAYEMDS
jgi:hypothetical protein